MIITRDMLNKALEDKTPLFHDGDYIDDDVLYDLRYSPNILRKLPNGNKYWARLIPKSDREILCAELKGYTNKKEKYDNIYYNLKCKSCGKDFPFRITKSQIINNTFSLDFHLDIPYEDIILRPSAAAIHELFKQKFGKAYNLYVCQSCVEEFISDSKREIFEFLKQKNKFDWYRSNESFGDWKRKLFYKYPSCVGTKIIAIDGSVWIDAEYDEWEKCQLQKEEEERIRKQQKEEEKRNHRKVLEELRKQQKIDEETERERTRKANELFLARHQSNTSTQNYINKFCCKDSDVDIIDRKIQRKALSPEGVNYEVIQKHNSKLYGEYLQSPLWKIISSKVKWNAHNCCEKCGSKLNLEVHHTSYEFKGVEFLAFHTLKCLCSKCHKEEHKEQTFTTSE